MRVITLDNVCKFVEAKVGRPQKLIPNISLFSVDNCQLGQYAVIIDKDVNEDSVCNTESEGINCLIPSDNINDFHNFTPYLKSREALSGHLVVCGAIPTEEELAPYLYLI